MKKLRVVVLGAGFGGLELSTILSEALGDRLDLTLIDKSDSFVFGFSKLDIMFGHEQPEGVRVAYHHIAKPGVRFCQETITSVDVNFLSGPTVTGKYHEPSKDLVAEKEHFGSSRRARWFGVK